MSEDPNSKQIDDFFASKKFSKAISRVMKRFIEKHGLNLDTLTINKKGVILKIDTDEPQAYIELGDMLCELNYYEESINNYRQALDFNSIDKADIYMRIGDAYDMQGIKESTLEYYQKALKQTSKPKNMFKVYVCMGDVFYYKKNYEEALKYYRNALEINPEDFDVWLKKGFSLELLTKYNEAITCMEKAYSLQPNYYTRTELNKMKKRLNV